MGPTLITIVVSGEGISCLTMTIITIGIGLKVGQGWASDGRCGFSRTSSS